MKIVAKIISVANERSGTSARTGNVWKSCDFVIEGLESGHKYVLTTFSTNYIEDLKVGIVREFEFHGDANEYQGKYYNRLSLDRMSNVNIGNSEDRLQKATTPNGSADGDAAPQQAPQEAKVETKEGDSKLPF